MCVCAVCEGCCAHSWWSGRCEASRTENTQPRSWRTSSVVWEDMESCLTNSRILGTGVAPAEGLFHYLCKLLLLLYCSVILLPLYLTIVLVFTVHLHCLQCRCTVLARAILSVCPSVTLWYCVQTNEDTIVRFSASGRTVPLVSGEVKFIWLFAGDHPLGRR